MNTQKVLSDTNNLNSNKELETLHYTLYKRNEHTTLIKYSRLFSVSSDLPQ